MKLSTLKANPTNPRIIKDEKFQKLVKSIEEFPEMLEARPIVVNPEMIVIGGNMRFKACKAAGLKEAPVYMATWGETKDREFIIKDNVSSGENDFDILANEWDAEELNEWGLDVWTGEPEETEGFTDPDDVPEVPEEAKTKLGDVWLLGEHRVMCGDSTSKEAVEILMDGEKADMVFTDPPYGMFLDAEGFDNMPTAKGTTHKSYSNVIGDADDFTPELISTIFKNFEYCKEVFVWGADYFAELLPNKNNGSWVVWDKRKEGGMDKMFGASFELCWSKNKHKREIARILWAGYFGMSKDDTKVRVHPTQKPIELPIFFFDKWGKSKDIIADLYLGSGSTLIAAEKTNRKCYGMELDPKYCDVIVKRWEDFTGKKAVKENL